MNIRQAIAQSVFLVITLMAGLASAGERLTIAAAADLKIALPEVVALYGQRQPADQVELIFGSSGKFATQIRNGAPFDLFFSADIELPRALLRDGFAVGEVVPYALGRLVLWSTRREVAALPLAQLAGGAISRLAIANPKHAPYGQRAAEALRAAGAYERIAGRLVYGENIAQTAQFALSGSADAGIIALGLALTPEMQARGHYVLIDAALHQPLLQGFVRTRHGAASAAAQRFADFMATNEVRSLLSRYGFSKP